jgi:hypothetical protein
MPISTYRCSKFLVAAIDGKIEFYRRRCAKNKSEHLWHLLIFLLVFPPFLWPHNSHKEMMSDFFSILIFTFPHIIRLDVGLLGGPPTVIAPKFLVILHWIG